MNKVFTLIELVLVIMLILIVSLLLIKIVNDKKVDINTDNNIESRQCDRTFKEYIFYKENCIK